MIDTIPDLDECFESRVVRCQIVRSVSEEWDRTSRPDIRAAGESANQMGPPALCLRSYEELRTDTILLDR